MDYKNPGVFFGRQELCNAPVELPYSFRNGILNQPEEGNPIAIHRKFGLLEMFWVFPKIGKPPKMDGLE